MMNNNDEMRFKVAIAFNEISPDNTAKPLVTIAARVSNPAEIYNILNTRLSDLIQKTDEDDDNGDFYSNTDLVLLILDELGKHDFDYDFIRPNFKMYDVVYKIEMPQEQYEPILLDPEFDPGSIAFSDAFKSLVKTKPYNVDPRILCDICGRKCHAQESYEITVESFTEALADRHHIVCEYCLARMQDLFEAIKEERG